MAELILTPTKSQHKRVYPANSPEAHTLWLHRTGRPLYQYTQQRAGWAVRCPHCGGLLMLEVIFDSENGGQFVAEVCPCGGAS